MFSATVTQGFPFEWVRWFCCSLSKQPSWSVILVFPVCRENTSSGGFKINRYLSEMVLSRN